MWGITDFECLEAIGLQFSSFPYFPHLPGGDMSRFRHEADTPNESAHEECIPRSFSAPSSLLPLEDSWADRFEADPEDS